MFPQLDKVGLDWEILAAKMNKRRAELTPHTEARDSVADGDKEGTGVDDPKKLAESAVPVRKRSAANPSHSA